MQASSSVALMRTDEDSSSTESCFVCGAPQAIWEINSKPSEESQPFFPFLQHQKTPFNARDMDRNGKVSVCNVCYSFLIQQWRSYETTRTPVLKRLYWLKRPWQEYRNHEEPDTGLPGTSMAGELADENASGDWPEVFGHPKLQSQLSDAEGDTWSEMSTQACNNHTDISVKSEYKDENTDSLTSSGSGISYQDAASLLRSCALCLRKIEVCDMKYVHTQPQTSQQVPYFPSSLFSGYLRTERDFQLNISGRVQVCSPCYGELHRQWHDFNLQHVPIPNRCYKITGFDSRINNKLSCFLCGNMVVKEDCNILTCKDVEHIPYYPFLKNLKTPYNAVAVDENGITYSCEDCRLFLRKQWQVFEDMSVPQEERVYRTHPNQPPLLPTSLAADRDIACFICSEVHPSKYLKRIYCNVGSNMNLGFLSNFRRSTKAIFMADTGETLVCLACFKELKQHWHKYRTSLFNTSVDNSTCSGDQEVSFGQLSKSCGDSMLSVGDKEAQSSFTCLICSSAVFGKRLELNVFPVGAIGSQDEKPFFPCLSDIRKADTGSEASNIVFSCELCAANLMAQWEMYEKDKTINESVSKWDRKYRVDYFLCPVCGDSMHRKNVQLVEQHLVKSDAIKSSNILVVDGCVALCRNCNQDMLLSGAGQSGKSSKLFIKEEESEQSCVVEGVPSDERSHSPPSLRKKAASPGSEVGMKATATVPPFFNVKMRSHSREGAGSSAEGSFAAALRKLAQQAPGVPTPDYVRELRQSTPTSKHDGFSSMMVGQHSVINHRNGARVAGTPSITAPVVPPPVMLDAEKQHELLMKTAFSRPHSRDHLQHSHSDGGAHHHAPGQLLPSMFPFAGRDEHLAHRRSQDGDMSRNSIDRVQRHLGGAVSAGAMSGLSHKDRSSANIGLVHPQPIRKLPEEETAKPSMMNLLHYPSRDGPAGVMRLPSPTELPRFGPFGPPPPPPSSHHAVHGSTQASCPVHGHDTEHPGRAAGLPFDPLGHLSRDFHGVSHNLVSRSRDEAPFMHGRHAFDRKEAVSSHGSFEEDLWRRSVDYRWPGLPPHLLDEHYRRHILSVGGHEHSLKDSQHFLPQFFYGRDYPLPVDTYLHPSVAGPGDIHRPFPPAASPRLLDYYRRGEPSVVERTRGEFEQRDVCERLEQREVERKQDAHRKEKESKESSRRTPSVDSFNKKHDDFSTERSKQNSSLQSERQAKTEPPTTPQTPHKMPIFKGINFNNRKCSPPKAELASKPNSICNLINSKAPDSTSEYAAASILASMNRFNQSPCSDEVDSITSGNGNEPQPIADAALQPSTLVVVSNRDAEKKHIFMSSLGLVPHTTRQALEEDYERKRWERKLRKIRGRPKKRSKRENTEEISNCSRESDNNNRPGSELDFYSGPMTRKKQQLLQEQETLLEQIQKSKAFGNSSDSCESDNSSNGDRDERSPSARKSKRKEDVERTVRNEIARSPFSDPDRGYAHGSDDASEGLGKGGLASAALHVDVAAQMVGNCTNPPTVRDLTCVEQSRLVAMLRDGTQSGSDQSPWTSRVSPAGNGSFPKPHLGVTSQQAKVSPDANKTLSITGLINHRSDSDDAKMLDCSVFGRCLDGFVENTTRWSGLEAVAQSYMTYIQEHDSKRCQLKRKYDELQRLNRSQLQQRDQLDKDITAANDRLAVVAEQRRSTYQRIEQLHQVVRAIKSL